MTIKYPDCNKCYNRGWVYQYRRQLPGLAIKPFQPEPSLTPGFERIEVACDCHYGQQYQIWQNRFSHPEYENPLAKLTDEDLLRVLDYYGRNQDATDAEFEL